MRGTGAHLATRRPLYRRAIATAELTLILPAVLFMIALFMRSAFQAHLAEAIVAWYSARMWTLWVLLLGLPFAAVVIGCSTIVGNWRADDAFRQAAGQTFGALHSHLAMLLVALATAMAGCVLMIVVLHMAAH
jgi:hypothetical protein